MSAQESIKTVAMLLSPNEEVLNNYKILYAEHVSLSKRLDITRDMELFFLLVLILVLLMERNDFQIGQKMNKENGNRLHIHLMKK